ncbi:YifB family Mg chelatase-like AAA ATPase, partial [bacterium]|nr:YifB family Mg chelatase-like AAA ATPase [bacterium]
YRNLDITNNTNDMSLIAGQEHAKRALEIAAAGGHNIFLFGPPGTGKTLLAKAFSSILPKMSFDEILEVSKIYSISGFLDKSKPLLFSRPVRNPHHTASHIALVGGGQNPKPGEISLSHRGVLFLDEFPEFPTSVLEVLREPLEERKITISRASGRVTYPSNFILVAAANPCPCGYYQDEEKECICSNSDIARYNKKLSGPLLDRIDIFIKVPRIKYEKLTSNVSGESSNDIRARVDISRSIQAKRFSGRNIKTNSEMGIKEIKKYCKVDNETDEILRNAVDSLTLSARGLHKILKLSRTIADLKGNDNISKEDVLEAIQYRNN